MLINSSERIIAPQARVWAALADPDRPTGEFLSDVATIVAGSIAIKPDSENDDSSAARKTKERWLARLSATSAVISLLMLISANGCCIGIHHHEQDAFLIAPICSSRM